MSYIVKGWIDPYNESGLFRMVEEHATHQQEAISKASDKHFQQAIVIDLSDGSTIYSRGIGRRIDRGYHPIRPSTSRRPG